jgi:ElaA protein
MSGAPRIHVARFDELTARTLHGILKVRSDVFIVEQQCAYPDIDGRDAAPGTLHLWIECDGEVVSTVRILDEPGGTHAIGRVSTLPAHRGKGLAGALMREAITVAGLPVDIKAQSYLAAWYAQFGFAITGAGWMEDGIEHVPMRLDTPRPATPRR